MGDCRTGDHLQCSEYALEGGEDPMYDGVRCYVLDDCSPCQRTSAQPSAQLFLVVIGWRNLVHRGDYLLRIGE